MAKQRHEAEQNSSSRAALIGMSAAGLAVAALVVWALTRTVQPAPSVMAEVPTAAGQPAATTSFPTNVPPADTAQNPVQITTAQSSTAAPTPVPPQTDENASVKRMSIPELRSKLDGKQVTVIDVRDKTSYINSHIPGALHIPMAQVESQVSFLPKNKPIVTYCT